MLSLYFVVSFSNFDSYFAVLRFLYISPSVRDAKARSNHDLLWFRVQFRLYWWLNARYVLIVLFSMLLFYENSQQHQKCELPVYWISQLFKCLDFNRIFKTKKSLFMSVNVCICSFFKQSRCLFVFLTSNKDEHRTWIQNSARASCIFMQFSFKTMQFAILLRFWSRERRH